MAIVIISVIATIAGPVLAMAVDAITLHLDDANLGEGGRIAIARMTRETRRLRNDESVVTATGVEFEFVDVDDVQIRYRLVGTDLMRRESAAGTESDLIAQVQASGLAFIYYDDDGNTIATPAAGLGTSTDIRRIEIQLTLSDGTNALPLVTIVRPRNLRHESNLFS